MLFTGGGAVTADADAVAAMHHRVQRRLLNPITNILYESFNNLGTANIVNAAVRVRITVTLASGVGPNQALRFTFPTPAVSLSSVILPPGTTPPTLYDTTMQSPFTSVTVARSTTDPRVITVQHSPGGGVSPLTVYVELDGFTNPPVAGLVYPLVYVEKLISGGTPQADSSVNPNGWMIQPGVLTLAASNYATNTAAANAAVQASLSFTKQSTFPVNGYFVVEFSKGGALDLTGGPPTLATLVPSPTPLTITSVTPTPTSIKLTLQNTGAAIPSAPTAAPIRFAVNGFSNPNRVGALNALVSLKMLDAANYLIDQAAVPMVAGWNVVGPTAITSDTWLGSSTAALATGVSVDITFTIAQDLPNTGAFLVEFSTVGANNALLPAMTSLTVAAVVVSPSSVVSLGTPTSSIGATSNTIRVPRDGSGSTIAAGTQLKLTLGALTNPNRVGAVAPLVSLKAVSGAGDTNQDVAAALPTSGWTIVAPAVLTPVNWALAGSGSNVANAVTSFAITVTVATDWPNNARLVIDFTNAASRHALVVPAAAGITASLTTPSANFVSPVTVSGTTGQVLTLVRSSGTTITAGTAVTVLITGLLNPNALGTVDAMTSLKTYDSAGTTVIDVAQTLPAGTWSVVGPLALTAALTSTVTAASAPAVPVTVSFNIAQPLAAAAMIVVVFGGAATPTGIHDIDIPAAPTLSSTAVSGAGAYGAVVDGSFSVSAVDQTVTVVRDGTGTDVPEPTTATTPVTVSFTFCCVVNPNRIGAVTALASVKTYATSADTTAAESTTGTQPAGYVVTGPTFMTGYTWSPKTPQLASGNDDTAAHSTVIVLQFTIFTDWPADGTIVLSFPTLGSGNRMYLTVPASGVTGSLLNITPTEPMTGTSVGQTLTLRRTGSAVVPATAVAAGTLIQVEISGFTNPNTVSENPFTPAQQIAALLGLETQTSAGASLDVVKSGFSLGWYLYAPAVLTGVSFQSNTNAAMAPVRVIIQFTIASDLPAGAQIIITFPTAAGDPHALVVPAAVTLDAYSLSMTGTFSVSVTGTKVTLQRIDDPFGTAAANFESPAVVEVQLGGFTNPNAVGAVTALAGLRTVQSNGVTAMDIAASLPVGWVIAAPAVLIAVSYNSVIKTADAKVDIIFTFTVATALPDTGKIVIVFPAAGPHAVSITSAATVASVTSNLPNPVGNPLSIATDTATLSPQVIVTITRTGGGSTVAAGSVVKFTLSTATGGFINPPSLNAVDPLVSLQTQTSTGAVLDEYDAALAPMTTWSIQPGSLTSVTIVASNNAAGAPTDLTFQFSLTRVLPSTGDIYITFPDTSSSSRLAIVLPATASVTVVGTPGGIDGTLTPLCAGQTLTLVRSVGSAVSPLTGVPISFRLSGFTSPNVAGGLTDTFVAMQTRDSTTQTIDQAAGSTLADSTPYGNTRWYLGYPGNLYDVVLSSNTSTYERPVAVQVDFSIASDLPVGGSIGIVFPTATTSSLTVPTTVAVQSTSLDGTLTASVSGQKIVLARSGGTLLAAPTLAAVPVRVSVVLSGFVNPSVNDTLVPALLYLETHSTAVAASTLPSTTNLLDRALSTNLLPGWRIWVPTLPVLLNTEVSELLYAYYFGADPTGTFYPVPDHPPKHVTRDTLVRAMTGGGYVSDAIIQSAQMQVVSVNGTTDLGRLWYTDQYNIVGAWNTSTSTLSLTGDAPAILYQLALLNVTYDCPTSLHISQVPNLRYQQVCSSVKNVNAVSTPLFCRDITLRAARRVYTDDKTGHLMNYQEGPQPAVV
jgi:hypothetical protein